MRTAGYGKPVGVKTASTCIRVTACFGDRPLDCLFLIQTITFCCFASCTRRALSRGKPSGLRSGGGLAEGETFEQAAIRELFEETGFVAETAGPQIAQRFASFALPTGELVEADERYFVVRVHQHTVSNAHRTEMERTMLAVHFGGAAAAVVKAR
jgi:hypothetical protein